MSLKSTAGTNYELYDTIYAKPTDAIIKPFTVGDNRTGVTVNYGPTSYTFNGNPQGTIPTISGYTFAVNFTISKLDPSDGQYKPFGTQNMPMSDFPVDVGSYMVELVFDDPTVEQFYRLDPGVHYFTIDQLELETNGWTANSGNTAPTENVIGSVPYKGGSNYSDLYDYTVYES